MEDNAVTRWGGGWRCQGWHERGPPTEAALAQP